MGCVGRVAVASWTDMTPCQSHIDLFSPRGVHVGFCRFCIGPVLTKLNPAWAISDPIHSHVGPIQVGCERVRSDMDSIAPDMDPIWIRWSQVRIGSGLKWIHSIPIQVVYKRVGSVLDSSEPAMDPIWFRFGSGTDRIWIELDQPHSNSGRMQTFWVRYGSD